MMKLIAMTSVFLMLMECHMVMVLTFQESMDMETQSTIQRFAAMAKIAVM